VNTSDINLSKTVEVFPNPVAKGEPINIGGEHLLGEVTISLFNAAGLKLDHYHFQNKENGQWSINNDLPAGLYWIHIYNQGKVVIKLISVQ
jgi:hypothetical protein